jgi:hypothetical protein
MTINGTSTLNITAPPPPAPAPALPATIFDDPAVLHDPVDPARTGLGVNTSSLVAGERVEVVLEPRDAQGNMLRSLLHPERFTLYVYHESDEQRDERENLTVTARVTDPFSGQVR